MTFHPHDDHDDPTTTGDSTMEPETCHGCDGAVRPDGICPDCDCCDDCGQPHDDCAGYCGVCGDHYSAGGDCACQHCHDCGDRLDWDDYCPSCDYCPDCGAGRDRYWGCEVCEGEVDADPTPPLVVCCDCGAPVPAALRVVVGKVDEGHRCAAHVDRVEVGAYPLPTSLLDFTFGVEVEVGSNGARLLAALQTLGLTECDALHPYHCACGQCRDSHVAAQTDPTVDAEMVTRVLSSRVAADWRVLRGLVDSAADRGCQMTGNVGAHVNIGKGITWDPADCDGYAVAAVDAGDPVTMRTAHPLGTVEVRQQWRLTWLLAAYAADWGALAGTVAGVRSYNGTAKWTGWGDRDLPAFTAALRDVDRLPADQWHEVHAAFSIRDDWAPSRAPYPAYIQHWLDGRWLADKGNRWEFRAWNGTRAYWRSALSVAVSAAAVAWATSDAPIPADWDRVALTDVLRPFLSTADAALADDQRAHAAACH